MITEMEEFIKDLWVLLINRVGGPLTFRFFVAPVVVSIFAIRAGLRDAKKGRDPFFYVLLHNTAHRKFLLRHGWKEIARVFIVMTVIDTIYQIIVFQWVFPGQVLIVATFLAVLPYLLMRGLVTRIGNAIIRRRKQSKL